MGTVAPDKNEREVFMKISFLKISDISTISESFTADIFLQARWREPALDHSRNVNTEINWSSYWNPKIVIPNILSERKHLVWNMIQTDENGQTYVLEKHRIKAVFAENQELLLFPFDIQDLSVLVSSSLSVEEVNLLEDDREVSNVHKETFTKQQEWSLYDCVTFTSTELTKEYANTMYKNPGMYINCMAKRRGGFFIWNVMLIMAIITSLSLATFAVNRTKTENRLQLTFMLVLTSVTFKFVTNQILPKISYITHFDGYIIGSMMFLYSVALFHALTSIITDNDTLNTVDWWGFIGFLSFYAIYNVIFIIIVVISVYPRWSAINKMVDKYQAIITSLSLATFAVNRTKTENRLQLTFMLVLTSVTFKFVTNQILPKISYITHFDGYIIGSMMFLYSVALFHALTSIITDNDTLNTVDWWGFIGFLSFYAIYNVIFIIIVVISVYPRWSTINKMVDKYQAKKEVIQGSGQIQNTGKFRTVFRRKTTKIKITG